MPVLDASAIINRVGEPLEEKKYFTVPEVIKEIKDLVSRQVLELAKEKENIIVFSPSKKNLERTKEAAKKLNVLKDLSDTDLKVIALGREKNQKVVTDDYRMQKTCKKLKIGFEPVIHKGIEK